MSLVEEVVLYTQFEVTWRLCEVVYAMNLCYKMGYSKSCFLKCLELDTSSLKITLSFKAYLPFFNVMKHL
jgi:hypothetical protein